MSRVERATGDPEREPVIEFGGRRLRLLAARAAIDEESRAVLVADLHLDRSESARRHGGAAPDGVLLETLDRLGGIVERFDPARVIVLGDLLHDARGPGEAVVEAVAAWRRACRVPIDLVGGNHDRGAGRVLAAWSIRDLGGSGELGGMRLVHDPAASGASPTIGGHLHPMAELRGGARRLLLPCFRLSRRMLVLPAFTAFARGVRFPPSPDATLFAIAEGRVIEVPPLRRHAAPRSAAESLRSRNASDPIEPPPSRGAPAGAAGGRAGPEAAGDPSHP